MTARAARIASLLLFVALAACTSAFEVPIETPIEPELDVSPFQRVYVAGFLTAGSDDVDTNLETVRLLRSQLRTKSSLRVVDADVLPLSDVARSQGQPAATPEATDGNQGAGTLADGNGAARSQTQRTKPRDEKELATYESIFANVNYWKKIGEEYQQPLIVTGTVYFVPYSRSGPVVQEQEIYDQFGRRRVQPVRVFVERKGYILRPKFVFIDGRTGTVMHSESQREERLYLPQQNVPALSSYFEMMDAILPGFLSALSEQKVKGSRVLLK